MVASSISFLGISHLMPLYFCIMKLTWTALIISLALSWHGCSTGEISDSYAEEDLAEGITFYGEVIETNGGLNGPALRKALMISGGRTEVRFEGEIVATCPKKGCWMDVVSEKDTVFVRFQDYGFFVPTEGVEGKRTIVEGEAFFDTLSVADQQHYAQDAGWTEEEIAEIREPELRLAFMATGVMIED